MLGYGGYAALFLIGAIATTLIPLSPEIVAVAVWDIGMPVIPSISALLLGNYIGNVANYVIGATGLHWAAKKYLSPSNTSLERAERLFKKHGPPILLLSWVPIIGDPLTFIPGIVRYNFKKFTMYILIGKMFRYALLYTLFELVT